jgi:hypothetical protein
MGRDSLPFSIHLVYAIVDAVRSRDRGGARSFGETGNESKIEPFHGSGEDELVYAEHKGDEQGGRFLDYDLKWPLKGKLWPNWILQLVFQPVFGLLRIIGLDLSYPRPSWL